MDNFLYNSKKIIRTPELQAELREEVLLSDLEHRKFKYIDFCFAMRNEFRVMLNKQKLNDIIHYFFKIEEQVYKLKEYHDVVEEDFTEFYKTLAPMLLRIIWEKSAFSNTEENLYDGLRSSLLVALEEELFYWEEKVKTIDN